MKMQTLVIDIEGMTCSGCINGVQRAVGKLDGVGAVTALQPDTAAVPIYPRRVTPVQMAQAIEKPAMGRAPTRHSACLQAHRQVREQ